MADTSSLLWPKTVAAIPDGLAWEYRIVVRGGRENHFWGLIGNRGGIHVHAWESSSSWRDERWMGGIERHSATRRDYDSESPSHDHCWLIGKPCWHDGSSLQFSEQVAPYLPQPGRSFEDNDHLDVLRVMISRYNSWLSDPGQAQTQETE